jgi:adenylate kinase
MNRSTACGGRRKPRFSSAINALLYRIGRLVHPERRGARYFVLLGGPGAGKGTVAEELVPYVRRFKLSTGDLFRAEIDGKTPLGAEIQATVKGGGLVPDEVTVGLVKRVIHSVKYIPGAVTDGFPRTAPQAKALERLLAWLGNWVEIAFFLDVEENELINRISKRRVCSNKACGKIYHLDSHPSLTCDVCGSSLFQRADDNEATVLERLRIYRKSVRPLIDYYRSLGVLVEIKQTQGMTKEQVFELVKQEVDCHDRVS